MLGTDAYCVDAGATVIDPTWPPDIPPPSYFGVAFDTAAVVGVFARIRVGVLLPGGLLRSIDWFYPSLTEDWPASVAR